MNKFCLFALCFFSLFAKSVEWNFEQDLSLQKDEVVNAKVFTNGVDKSLSLRWTLYKKEGLVVLVKYDGFSHHFILYQDLQRHTYSLKIDESANDVSRLVVSFKGFDKDAKEAKIWLGVQGHADLVLYKGI